MAEKDVLSQEEIDALLHSFYSDSDDSIPEEMIDEDASAEESTDTHDSVLEPIEQSSEQDIPVLITVEIGHTKMPIRNLLQLNQGSIIALDRLTGEALDVLVNGRLVAHGEVVAVNDKLGVRLTDIVSKAERIKRFD